MKGSRSAYQRSLLGKCTHLVPDRATALTYPDGDCAGHLSDEVVDSLGRLDLTGMEVRAGWVESTQTTISSLSWVVGGSGPEHGFTRRLRNERYENPGSQNAG